jgi:aminoglycoside 6'-N-acetyltransferase I
MSRPKSTAVKPDDATAKIHVRLARAEDCAQVARMCAALWSESSAAEHAAELLTKLKGRAPSTLPVTIFVVELAGCNSEADREDAVTAASAERQEAINEATLLGFVEVGLRSHAEACDPSHAVGYLEGWYVAEDWRGRGLGRRLLSAAEEWARRNGCVEMASDAWIENNRSQRAHEACGYKEVDRCVHYHKRL